MSTSPHPPELPDVVDEAGDTPAWLPILGACLLGVIAIWIAVGRAMPPADEAQPKAAQAGQEAAQEAEQAAPERGNDGDDPALDRDDAPRREAPPAEEPPDDVP